MTNSTAIATPAAPQRTIPVGPDRTRKDAAGNGPSFASVMQAHRGDADQGRAHGAAHSNNSRAKAPQEPEAPTTTDVGASDARAETLGDAPHLRGLSALHRRDWHAALKALTSGEDQAPTAEQSEPAQAEMPADESHAPALRHKRAANSNAMPATSMPEAASEQSEDAPKVAPTGRHEEPLSVRTEKPGKHQPDEKADLRAEVSPEPAPVPQTADQLAKAETPAARKSVAEARAKEDAGASAATTSSNTEPSAPTSDQHPQAETPAARKLGGAEARANEDAGASAATKSSNAETSAPTGYHDPKTETSAARKPGNAEARANEDAGASAATKSSNAEPNAPIADQSPTTKISAARKPGDAKVRVQEYASRGAATTLSNAKASAPTADKSQALDGARSTDGQTASPPPGAEVEPAAPQPNTPVQATAPAAPVRAEATPAAPGFTVEMTVAAAKYALASGNAAQGTSRETEEVTEVGTQSPSAERPRVAILPTSAQVAAPGISSPTLSMPPAFVADDQARQSAKANGAQEEIKTLGADKAPNDSPRNKAEPDTAGVVTARAPSVQAPAMQQTQASPAATVVAALAADPAARPQPISPLAQVLSPQSASEPKTLTIQLHPAELGVVYATFQMTGGQMSVEISAETDDARSRLAAESHTIAKSLRSLGIDVDQVTVMQTTQPVATVARTDDAAAQNLPSGRDQQPSFGAQTSGGGGSRLGGQQNGRSGHDMAGAGRDQPSAADRGDGGVYI